MAKKPQVNQVRESVIQKQILDYLKTRNDVVCWRNQNGGIYDPRTKKFRRSNSIKGASDIFGIQLVFGKFIAIEVKSEIGRLSSEQVLFLDLIKRSGGIAGVARSIDDVKKLLLGPAER